MSNKYQSHLNVNETIVTLNNILSDALIKSNQKQNFLCAAANLTSLSSVLLKSINIVLFDNHQQIKSSKLNDESNKNEIASNNNVSNLTASSFSSVRSDYDYSGAVVYFLFILCFYGFFVIIMIILQTKMSNLGDYEYSDDITAGNVLKRIRTEDVRQRALEDLRDPAFRQKIWNVYFETQNTYKLRRSDSKRIQRIDKKIRQYNTISGISSERTTSILNSRLVNQNNSNTDTFYSTNSTFYDRQQSSRSSKIPESNLFLLKDLNKFEGSLTLDNNNNFNNHNTIASTNYFDKFNINNNTNGNQNISLQSQFINTNINNTNSNLNSPSMHRFKVERIKESA